MAASTVDPAPAATTNRRRDAAVVPVVVQQHAEEAAMLRHVRSVLVRAPHVRLLQLGRLDERVAAHLDGLAVAGRYGDALLRTALDNPGAGEIFAFTVRALEQHDGPMLAHALALVDAVPEARRAVTSAFGWVEASRLHGVVRKLLESKRAAERELGVAACRAHRVDPGPVLLAGLGDRSADLRAECLRAAAELGRVELLPQVRQAMSDDAPEVVFWAAWASCLLGDRDASLRVLAVASQQSDARSSRALSLLLAASPFVAAGDYTRQLSAAALAPAAGRAARRRLVRAFGLLGDMRFVPWLIERMAEPELMRLAGEAFSWITGADLARDDLETLTAPQLPEHPSDDPADDEVGLDEDESLPWPDRAKLTAWWERHHPALAAAARGGRLLAGAAPSPASARLLLRERGQRVRALAAEAWCLLEPGTRLFPIAAPTLRQRRWLASAPA